MPAPNLNVISIGQNRPPTQASSDGYFLLKIYEDGNRSGKNSAKTIWALPLPKGFVDIHDHDYSPAEMNALMQFASQNMDLIPGLQANQTYDVSIGDALKSAGIAVGEALGAEGIISAGLVTQRAAKNPFTQLAYKSPGLRQFQFTWALSPISSQEAELIDQMVKQIRRLIYPTLNGPLFKYPAEFEVTIKSRGTTFLNTVASACTSFQVTYDTQGSPYLHRDGYPVTTNITISLQEVRLLNKDDIATLYG